ncbi:hypothetical protein C6843_00010 [Neisseria gonorrhoeae]
MDDLILYFLSGISGNQVAEYIIKNNREIKVPFIALYAIFFTLIYTVALLFLSLIYWVNGAEIAWKGIGIFSMSVSFCIVFCLYLIDKAGRCKDKKQ